MFFSEVLKTWGEKKKKEKKKIRSNLTVYYNLLCSGAIFVVGGGKWN